MFAWALAASAPASAETEFCPASVGVLHPLDGDWTASLYSFALDAQGARHVTADVMVLTDAGWFDIAVPSTQIAERDKRFRDPYQVFTYPTFTSAPVYVRFPSAVHVAAAFVADAAAPDDGASGWAARGKVVCQAPAGFGLPSEPRASGDMGVPGYPIKLLNPRTDLTAPPPAGAPLLHAVAASAPGSTACAVPAKNATVTAVVNISSPPDEMPSERMIAMAEIAIGADGKIADEHIVVPSGNAMFDNHVLATARLSTYAAGRSFCRSAPGYYLFRVDYHP